MNKQQMVSRISEETGYRYATVDNCITALLDDISEELREGNSVKFAGFGTFEVRKRAPRKGRNLRTGEPMDISGRLVPVFRAGSKLRNFIAMEA